MDRVATAPFRRHNYPPENAIASWARQAAARTGIQALREEGRPDLGPANAGGNQANDYPLCLPVSSSLSSDVSVAGEGCEAFIGTAPSCDADPTESPPFSYTPGYSIAIQNEYPPWVGPQGAWG